MEKHWYLWAAGVFLLGALGSWPYAYYQLLRWVVCGVAAYTSYTSFKEANTGWGWIMAIIAILFNPIAPVYFSKGTWSLLDIIAAIIFFALANSLKNSHEHHTKA